VDGVEAESNGLADGRDATLGALGAPRASVEAVGTDGPGLATGGGPGSTLGAAAGAGANAGAAGLALDATTGGGDGGSARSETGGGVAGGRASSIIGAGGLAFAVDSIGRGGSTIGLGVGTVRTGSGRGVILGGGVGRGVSAGWGSGDTSSIGSTARDWGVHVRLTASAPHATPRWSSDEETIGTTHGAR
jgi:hypothetical protein